MAAPPLPTTRGLVDSSVFIVTAKKFTDDSKRNQPNDICRSICCATQFSLWFDSPAALVHSVSLVHFVSLAYFNIVEFSPPLSVSPSPSPSPRVSLRQIRPAALDWSVMDDSAEWKMTGYFLAVYHGGGGGGGFWVSRSRGARGGDLRWLGLVGYWDVHFYDCSDCFLSLSLDQCLLLSLSPPTSCLFLVSLSFESLETENNPLSKYQD